MFRLLGRDPDTQPLTELERVVFYRVTLEHVEAEFTPRAEIASLTGRVIDS